MPLSKQHLHQLWARLAVSVVAKFSPSPAAANGMVYAWGANQIGQLGNGTAAGPLAAPTPVLWGVGLAAQFPAGGIRVLAAQLFHTVALSGARRQGLGLGVER